MGSVTAVNPPSQTSASSGSSVGGGLKVEALQKIDVTQLSQLELQTLSSCSASFFDLSRTDDMVSPQLDRSLFNESSGSRRQTYSRLHHRSHFRLPSPHLSLKPQRDSRSSSDAVNHSIIYFLKKFLSGNYNPPPPPPLPLSAPRQEEVLPRSVPNSQVLGFQGMQGNLNVKIQTGEKKRKRGRKTKNLNKKRFLESGVVVELQKVNQKGDVVNLEELEKNGDELFAQELKKRTVGLETEEGVLGFLWSLEGQWCSTRKKRKYVDAGLFGDALPIGWKILLGIRRRGFRPSIYCRRFVSPTSQQLLSCQEAALFLQSYFGSHDADQSRDKESLVIQKTCDALTAKNEHSSDKTDYLTHEELPNSNLVTTVTDTCEKNDQSMTIKHVPQVQVQGIFECVKCNQTFGEKNAYLQHLLTFHQKTTKRCRVGTPVGEGVIIKDGKYECQFCHKVFEERRSYNGHVGVHVRNAGKVSSELVAPVSVLKNSKSPSLDALPSSTSKMEALIEVAQSSVFETPEVESCDQTTRGHSPIALNLEETPIACSDYETNVASDHVRLHEAEEHVKVDKPAMVDLNACCSLTTMETSTFMSDDYTSGANIKSGDRCDSEHGRACDFDEFGNNSMEMDFGDGCLNPSNDNLEDTPGLNVGEINFPDGLASVPLAQSFQFFPSLDSLSNKVESEFSVVDQKLGNSTVYGELRFDDLDPIKYSFMNGEELQTFPGSSMNLGNDAGIVHGFNSSVSFDSADAIFNTLDANHLTTVCVWCRTEFKLDSIESEAPSDSIGYMCPTCKDKISGHLHGGLSLEPHGF